MVKSIIPKKLHSLIIYIIAQCGRELGAIELAKVIYLIDLEMESLVGKTMTGEKYTRQEKGPLAINFGNYISQMDGFELKVTIEASAGNSGIPKHNHILGNNPRFEPVLDSIDLSTILRVLNKVKDLSPIQIEKIAYSSEPMVAILKKEREIGHVLLGEPIDFSLIKPNATLAKWREYQKADKPSDKKFEDFLTQERSEVNDLISSWG